MSVLLIFLFCSGHLESGDLVHIATLRKHNRLLECRDKQDIEYATHAYMAGLYDAFRIMAVLFPNKWDSEDIRKLLNEQLRLSQKSL